MKLLRLAPTRPLIPAFFFCLLVLSVSAQTQTEIGPEAVWQPGFSAAEDINACRQDAGCSPAGIMAGLGASAEAIGFAESRGFFDYLSDFQESGVVDLGTIFHPLAANDNGSYAMLNGNPPFVSTRETFFPDLRTIPGYEALLAQYPQAILWGGDVGSPQAMALPGGGQRFTFVFQIVDGCHACGYVGEALVAYDFDAAGNYLGITYLDPASTPPPAGSASAGQFAYIEPNGGKWETQGSIWLVNADGSDPQQITNSDTDCCLAWSPDGSLLYFIRDARLKDAPETASPGTIMVYDFRTGQERVIDTPDMNLFDVLALSPDGRSLAFSSSEWVDIDPWGDVHKGCLYVMNIETGEAILVDCEAPGAIYSISLGADEVIAVEVGFYEGSRIAFYDSPVSPRRYDDRICCSDPKYAPNGTSLFTNGSDYGSLSSSLIYYESLSASPVVLTEMPNELGSIGWHDVSPDGSSLIYVRGQEIEVMDLVTGAITSVGITGYGPAFRPNYVGVTVDLTALLDRKSAVFEQLETTGYQTSAGVLYPDPIAAFDETAARALIDGLRAADPASVPPEQAAALERLVMQEEALDPLLDDYTVLASDQADVAVDLAGMATGTGLLAAKAAGGLQAAIADLLMKVIEDFIKLLLHFIDEEDLRGGMSDSIGLAITLLDVYADNVIDAGDASAMAEEFLERAQDDGVRALAFRELIPKFTGAVQPVVDQGVNSVTGEANPIWTVGGRTESAQIGLDGLTEQSAIMRELAHDVYTNSLGRGHDVNELLKDIVDLALLGTKNPIGLIFSIQTRLQQVLIDTAATSVLSGAMTCTRDAALLSGEFAFQPDRPVYVCEVPVPLDLGDFFRRLFTEKDGGKHYVGRLAPPAQSTMPEFDAALAGYRAAIAALSDALNAADPDAVRARTDELLAATRALDEEAMPVMARLGATAEGATAEAEEGAMALGTAITFARLDALFTLMAADAWLADPEAADAAAIYDVVLQAEENADLLGRVVAQAPLPAAPDAALTVVDAPAEWAVVVGEATEIPIRVINAGGRSFSGARLMLEIDGQTVAEVAVPDLGPGEAAELLPVYVSSEPGRLRVTARAVAGDRSDTRTLTLVVQPSAEAADGVAPIVADGTVDETEPPIGGNAARPILFGVMAVSGAVFLLSLGALLLRGRRKL